MMPCNKVSLKHLAMIWAMSHRSDDRFEQKFSSRLCLTNWLLWGPQCSFLLFRLQVIAGSILSVTGFQKHNLGRGRLDSRKILDWPGPTLVDARNGLLSQLTPSYFFGTFLHWSPTQVDPGTTRENFIGVKRVSFWPPFGRYLPGVCWMD